VWNILTKEIGRPDGKRPIGKPRRRWDIFEMFVQEVGW